MTTEEQIVRIKTALRQGRMIYNTGRKLRSYDIWETLHPDSRKQQGLLPLKNIIPNWKQLLPVKEVSIETLKQKENTCK